MEFLNIITSTFGEFVGSLSTNLISALLILVFGTLIAFFIAGIVRAILHKTDIDNRLSGWLSDGSSQEISFPVEKVVSSITFYFGMLFVIIQFLNSLNAGDASGPLSNLLAQASAFAPSVMKAALLTLAAIVVAFLAKAGLSKIFSTTKLDEKFQSLSEDGSEVSITKSLADTVFWLIVLFFLPSILAPLGLKSLLDPIYNIGNTIVDYIGNIIGAAVLFGVGLLVAKVLKHVVTGLLESSGISSFANKLNLNKIVGNHSLANILGTVIYILTIFTVTVQALDVLAIEAISVPAKEILYAIFGAVKGLLGAGIGLGVAYFVGKMVSELVVNLLTNIGFNNLFSFLGLPTESTEDKKTAAEIVGIVVLISVLLFTSNIVAEQLGFEVLSEKLDMFIVFAGQVLLGLIIFGAGLLLSNFASNAIQSSSIPQAKVLALVGQTAILFIAGAMALTQIGIGKDIVDLAFGILLGAIGIAFAIAVGLGCKDIAGEELKNILDSLRK